MPNLSENVPEQMHYNYIALLVVITTKVDDREPAVTNVKMRDNNQFPANIWVIAADYGLLLLLRSATVL